ncbi:MAG: hypothetical protein JKY02_08635 [Flavobacteriaceae bacterium]|nr:hypothetical protein [Flavobacteriaceae bacterium]
MNEKEQITYPANKKGNLYRWDFYDRKPYKVRVVSKNNPVYLFDANEDVDLLVKQWRRSFKLVPTDKKGEAEYQMNLEKIVYPDNENLNAKPIYDYSFKHFIIDRLKERKEDITSKKELVFYGRSLNNKPVKLQIALVLSDGSAFGKTIEIDTELKEYKLSLSDLKPVRTVTLPRPYPSFLPYYLEHNLNAPFDIRKVESVQFSIGPGIPKEELESKHGAGFIKLWLD